MREMFKSVFDADYQGYEVFLDKVLKPLFGDKLEVLPVAEDNPTGVSEEAMEKARIKKIARIANIAATFNRKPMEVFDITLEDRVDITRARVGIQQIIRRGLFIQTHAFMIFHAEHPAGENWRFSYALKLGSVGSMTDAKRYTYLFGQNMHCRTAIDRFAELANGEITDQKLLDAFNVEALSDEFFEEYRKKYAAFVKYITGKEFVKEKGKWVEKCGTPNAELMAQFRGDDKAVRDYVKKLMGRITFLHFLQKKGWMNWDVNYMQHLFEKSDKKDNFLEAVLEPLFFGVLNTKVCNRTKLFKERGWDFSLLDEWQDFPYLNGGLFEEDESDKLNVAFPESYFVDLFKFYARYNFTVDENDPDDAEVGIDPEMLGKIFENLLEDNKDKGAFYTPKEIVRYMCQESLTAYLVGKTGYDEELIRAFVIHPYDEVVNFDDKQQNNIYECLEKVKICDPAIGSGAFPMGLLNELVRCEEALLGEKEDDHQCRSGLKKYIIQNNIYGVDIEKGAIDIARLRFWLSIIVDEKEPSPLPNLDYKIMQGNSLLESYKKVDLSHLLTEEGMGDEMLGGLFADQDIIQDTREELAASLEAYFNCSDHEEKLRIQEDIRSVIKVQLSARNLNVDFGDIDIAANQEFFLWHTWFSDVFNRPSDCEKGFDIVIGNPPYLFLSGKGSPVRRLINEGKIVAAERFQELLNSYGERYPEVSQGCRDFYKWFYKLALNICRHDGVLAFITPDTFFSMPKYLDLRTQLFQHSVLSLIDLGFSVFDAPTVSSAICIVKKDKKKTTSVFLGDIRPLLNKENRDQIYSIVQEVRKEVEVTNNEICDYKHPIAKRLYDNPNLVGLGNYISFSEGEHDIQIDEALLSDHNEPGRIPVLIDSTMQRNGYVTKAFMLSNVIYQNPLHLGERCLVRKTGDTIVASLPPDPDFAVAHQNVYVAKDKAGMSMKFWMAILNSTMLTFLYQNGLFGQKGRTMAQFRIYALNALPIPAAIDRTSLQNIQNYATALLQSSSKSERLSIEIKIDDEVYKMYGLSQEEVDTITSVMRS